MFGQRFPSGSGSRLESSKDKSSHLKRGIVARFVSKGLELEGRGEERRGEGGGGRSERRGGGSSRGGTGVK